MLIAPAWALSSPRGSTQLLHNLDLVLCHDALGIMQVLFIAMGLVAVTVPAEVCCHHRKLLGQAWGDLVPHDVRLRIAVEEQ